MPDAGHRRRVLVGVAAVFHAASVVDDVALVALVARQHFREGARPSATSTAAVRRRHCAAGRRQRRRHRRRRVLRNEAREGRCPTAVVLQADVEEVQRWVRRVDRYLGRT